MYYAYYLSKIGLLAIAHQDKIYSIKLVKEIDTRNKKSALTDKVYQEISEYLEGLRKEFTIYEYLEPVGTNFQIKVWESLREIPYGESSTYSDLAIKIGHPQAIRATGSAIGKNPFLIVNPCHRVLRKDGNIGGFAYGNEVKKFLLDLENISYNL